MIHLVRVLLRREEEIPEEEIPDDAMLETLYNILNQIESDNESDVSTDVSEYDSINETGTSDTTDDSYQELLELE